MLYLPLIVIAHPVFWHALPRHLSLHVLSCLLFVSACCAYVLMTSVHLHGHVLPSGRFSEFENIFLFVVFFDWLHVSGVVFFDWLHVSGFSSFRMKKRAHRTWHVFLFFFTSFFPLPFWSVAFVEVCFHRCFWSKLRKTGRAELFLHKAKIICKTRPQQKEETEALTAFAPWHHSSPP